MTSRNFFFEIVAYFFGLKIDQSPMSKFKFVKWLFFDYQTRHQTLIK